MTLVPPGGVVQGAPAGTRTRSSKIVRDERRGHPRDSTLGDGRRHPEGASWAGAAAPAGRHHAALRQRQLITRAMMQAILGLTAEDRMAPPWLCPPALPLPHLPQQPRA